VSDEQFVKLCAIPKKAAAEKSSGVWSTVTSIFSGGGNNASKLVRDIKKFGKQRK
jgi:hypothetical protein